MMRPTASCPLLALSLLGMSPALGQSPPKGFADAGQPASWPAPTGAAHVTGLGRARFGMNEAEVRAAVAADFGAEVAAKLQPDDAAAGRTAVSAPIRWMTDVAPATLAYIFERGRLVQVNCSWRVPGEASQEQRAALSKIASEVTRNLYGSSWQPFTAVRGKPLGASAVLVFSGEDVMGGGVEVVLFGVSYSLLALDGTRSTSPPPTGEAVLRVSYAADIYGRNLLRQGDF